MAASKHRLREFQPLTSILQTVPQRLQKGLFSQDIEWTCLDVTKEYLAIGTNVGIVFLYDRCERTVKRLHCPGDDSSVTCVSLQNSVDYVVAMGTESAHVYIYQLPSPLPDRPKQLQMFKVENLHQVAVQCLAWSLNAMKLFSGDLGGTVVCTEIDYVEENCRSYEVCHENYTIVQLHYAYKTLLVSTLSHTLLCTVSDGDTRIVQVGQKQRKGLDAYGSTFLLGSYQAKDTILFAARPGLRIWKACGVSGVVQATYIFRDLMTEPSQGIELLPDTASDFSDGSTIDRQFGRLLLFNDTQLVTYRGTRLCVIDPGLGQFVGYHGNLGYISSIAACEDEIFVLRKVDSGRRLLRLGFSPEITEEIRRPLGVESHTPQTTISSTSSPVHTIVHSASAMSRGIVGALKGVGDMLHSSVEGQIVSSSTNPPPWGIVSGKNGDASALPHSDSIDSAKEANPSNVPSPSSEGSVKDIVSDAMASETDQVTSRPMDKTEPEEILTVEIYETPSECPADDKTSESVSQGELVGDGATLSTCEEQVTPSAGEVMHQARSHLPEKFLAVGDDPYEDIVFCSHTKKRKKKKAKLAVKEKDVSSVSSEGCTTSSGDRVVSSQSHNHLMTPRDGSTAYISAQDIGRVSPSSQDTDTANLTQVSQNHEESAVVALSENFSDTSILDVNTESEKVSLQKTESGDHGNDMREMCISEAESVPVSVAQLQTTKTCSVGVHASALCKTELSQHTLPQDIHDLAADGVSNKEHCESASHVVEQSADLPQVSDEKCQTEASDVVSVTPKDQLGGKALGVTTVASKGQSKDTAVVTNPATDPSQPNIDLATKSWFSLNATSPAKNLQHSTATNQPDVTTIAFPSDKPNISYSHKTSSPLESPDDFYSKYRHFSCITTDSEADVSLEQMLDYSTENDDSSASHEVDAMLADTWSEFLMSDKFEGLLGICMSERHLWIVDKHEVVAYSRMNKQQLNWRPVAEPAHQVAVSSSGAIVWRLYKGSVYVALRVTPTVPVGTKWNEVAREVKHIAVDDTVAWYVKTTGELMTQKGLCRERPSFRSHPVSCSHKILQVACYSGIVWVLTEQRHLLARTGIEPGREEGAAWKEVSRRSCPKAVSFDFGHENSVWVLDVSGHLWFTTGVRPLTPEGSGNWWQVSLSRYVMHDTTMLDLTHDTLRSLTSKLLGGCVDTEMTGVLTARHSGIWLWTPSNGRKMLACRGTLTGHHWQLVTPGGLPVSVKWKKLSLGCVSGDKEGYVWLQLSNGDVFCFLPSSKKLIEVAPPVAQQSFSCISGTRDAFWGLLADGGVYIRAGIGGRCVQGRSWSQQTMIQLGDAHLVSVSCGTQNVIVVDNTGQVYLRIGVKAPEKHHLCPAWVPIDGTTSTAGSKFTSIYTSPADWLVWALDSKNSVYVRKGITDELPIGTHWLYVPGIQASSLCISNEFVYALTPSGKIYVRYAITSTNPAGNYWKEIPGHFVAFAVTANDDMWALDESGQLHRRTIQHIHCDQYTRVKASGSVDEGWELI